MGRGAMRGRAMHGKRIAALLVAAGTLMAAPAARAADFSTSFEASDPAPTWTNTSEESVGVSGTKPSLPGSVDVMPKVTAVTANESLARLPAST